MLCILITRVCNETTGVSARTSIALGHESKHHSPETEHANDRKDVGVDADGAKPDVYKMAEMHREMEQDEHHTELHSYIGIALCCGFIFMLLVDQMGGSHAHSPGDGNGSKQGFTAAIGLVVHAAADGIAMGAAASSSRSEVAMLVFIAIMLHKAPAAFGLASFLLHEGFERNRIRRYLLIFSLAAPVMALLTYLGLSHVEPSLAECIFLNSLSLNRDTSSFCPASMQLE
eukprot:m.38057 g.38057  ORF g.38057 m.38057 type:complete len:230 (+) comp32509_c0_seq3:196-885(+)